MRFQMVQLEKNLVELDFLGGETNINVFFNPQEFEAFKKLMDSFRYGKFSSKIAESGIFRVYQDGTAVILSFDDGDNHCLVQSTRRQWARFLKYLDNFSNEEFLEKRMNRKETC